MHGDSPVKVSHFILSFIIYRTTKQSRLNAFFRISSAHFQQYMRVTLMIYQAYKRIEVYFYLFVNQMH